MKLSFKFLVILQTSTRTFAWDPGWGGGYGSWPSCASSCISILTSSSCTGDGKCVCVDSALISNANSCIDSSSCSTSDKEAIYQNIAQLCADVGVTVTAAPDATFSATSNSGSPFPSSWAAGSGVYGPFGGDWGPFGSSGAWTSGGPWSSWWDGNGCPSESWSGWTSGSWSSGAPWTTWTACTATTTATKTFTTTLSETVITSTSFGIQVAEQTGTSTGAVSTTTKPGAAYNNVAQMELVMVIVSFVVIIQG